MNRILIVEDESRIAAFVEKGLKANGFVTTNAATGSEALLMASSDDFDLMILDVGLPDMSGLDVLEQVRGCGDRLPVIILSAYDQLDHKITGLESGANDYITKPFRFEELLVRIKVQLRDRKDSPQRAQSTLVRAGDLELNLLSRQVKVGDRHLELSSREFALAEVLLRRAGQVMSRQQILDRVWGYNFDPGSNVVDVHVRNLRKKLGGNRIETVRGLGYRFKV
ncbi:MAG: response regulator transcription factor [Cyanobacteria bacterium P01_E01_bin.48]